MENQADDGRRAVPTDEARFRVLTEAMPQLVWTSEPDGAIDFCNSRWLTYTGLSAGEIQGDGWARALHPDDCATTLAAWQEATRTGGAYKVEQRLRSATGEYHWFLTRALPLRDEAGRIVKWYGTCTDIQDQKQAEQALSREQALLQTIIDRIPVMIVMYEPSTQVLRLNRAFEEISGWTAAEARETDIMAVCYPDPAVRQRAEAFMSSLQEGWLDIVLTTRDGRRLDTSWANILLPDGTRIGIGIDISERKLAEEALREADRRKDEFLATLAHELRNPLAPLRNALQVLRLAGSDPEQERLHALMERQVNHMVRLVDDLLEISRITSGTIELRRERVLLASLIASALETSRPMISAAEHRLTVSLPEEPLVLEIDPVRITQVFSNLLNNAARYTPPGGAIEILAGREGGEAVVRIRDTGRGIPADMLAQVFDMFTQVERSPEGGLGIGLTLVQRLVEMHGGRVAAYSEGPGRGSELTVRLPLAAAEQPEPQRGEAAMDLPSASRRILVVDDHEDAGASLGILLELLGHEVQVARSGLEALEILEIQGWRPDAVLLDISMPEMDGYEVARAVRRNPALAGLRLVAMTGWGQDEDRRRTREAGFDEHLIKPVDAESLRGLLADLGPAGVPAGSSAE